MEKQWINIFDELNFGFKENNIISPITNELFLIKQDDEKVELIIKLKTLKKIDREAEDKIQKNFLKDAIEKLSEYLLMEEVTKWGIYGVRLGLGRMKKLLEVLGNPEKDFKTVHVAGTNGKGSVCAYLNSVLIEAGYKVGMFTSPGVESFNDRIRINNKFITYKRCYELFGKVIKAWEEYEKKDEYKLNFFDLVTAISLLYFKENNIDIAILEIGLGGRYDSINAVENKLLSIITQIGMDHMDILGDTIEEIAYNKAGIIEKNSSAIIYPSPESAVKVILDYAREQNATAELLKKEEVKIIVQGSTKNIFKLNDSLEIEISLVGEYQIYNAALALRGILNLRRRGIIEITDEQIQAGFKNTTWPGRLECLSKMPKIFIDGAHNVDGIKTVIEFLKEQKADKIRIIIGFLKDKSHREMMELLADLNAEFYLAQVSYEKRKMPINEMVEELTEFGHDAKAFDSSEKAIDEVLQDVKENDLIIVTGSLYLVSEARKTFMEKLKIK